MKPSKEFIDELKRLGAYDDFKHLPTWKLIGLEFIRDNYLKIQNFFYQGFEIKERKRRKQILETWLTVQDVQRILRLSKNQTYDLVNSSEFPKVRLGRTIRIPPDEFAKFLKRHLYGKYDI